MAILVIACILAIATALALKSPRTALLAALFLASWGGLDVDLGLRLTAYQLVMAPLCLVMALRLLYPGQRPHALALGWPFAAMLLWAIINSAFQVATLPQAEIANSALRGPVARATIQILLHLFTIAPVILVPWLFRTPEDALKLLRVWFASTLTLALAGFLQLLIWYGTGFNPLPLGFSNTLLGGAAPVLREGIVNLDGLFIYRMNAFAAEPRYLGTAFGLAMVIVQGLSLALPRVPGRRLLVLWLFLLAALLLTYSTSGIAVWLIGTLTLLPAMWLTRVPIRRTTRSIVLAAGAVILPLVIAVIIADDAGIPVIEVINERTLDRFTLEAALEDFDLAIATWLASEPRYLWTGGGIGNAHLYATPYLLPEHAVYGEGQVFSAKTLVLRYLSEQGLIGLVLLFTFLLTRLAAAAWVRGLPWLAPLLPLSLALFAMVLGSSQLMTEVWFTAGTLVMLATHAARVRAAAPPAGLAQPA
jgi:hypothetical protein